MEKKTGELMSIKNFGSIGSGSQLTPEEVKNYMKSFCASNKRVKNPQFHATISCQGREYSKEELAQIAEKWLIKMGYGSNPFIIVHHSDTSNNHVHIISTRVDSCGKKISDKFEGIRAKAELDKIMKVESRLDKKETIDRLFSYSFSTISQFKLLCEKSGLTTAEQNQNLSIYYFNDNLKTYSKSEIDQKIADYSKKEADIKQIWAIINKYQAVRETDLTPDYYKLTGGRSGQVSGYHSELTNYLQQAFGLQFVFHFKDNKPPYGYTIIDHKNKVVYKGSEILKMNLLIENKNPTQKVVSKIDERAGLANRYNIESKDHIQILAKYYKIPEYKLHPEERILKETEKQYYKTMLSYFLERNPVQSLPELNITPVKEDNKLFLLDTGSMNILYAEEVLDPEYVTSLSENLGLDTPSGKITNEPEFHNHFSFDVFSSDVDDEKAHGRERKRKRNNS
ncbi:MAG: relaxase/mobilization nuclease domain-containing protein [Prolixibacteraceae bacterium]|nr:relaxase/mobilization nuclease domain-containing protein [Prolixibacteraceae bacterium]